MSARKRSKHKISRKRKKHKSRSKTRKVSRTTRGRKSNSFSYRGALNTTLFDTIKEKMSKTLQDQYLLLNEENADVWLIYNTYLEPPPRFLQNAIDVENIYISEINKKGYTSNTFNNSLNQDNVKTKVQQYINELNELNKPILIQACNDNHEYQHLSLCSSLQ